jgi:hypothetical protein
VISFIPDSPRGRDLVPPEDDDWDTPVCVVANRDENDEDDSLRFDTVEEVAFLRLPAVIPRDFELLEPGLNEESNLSTSRLDGNPFKIEEVYAPSST